MALSNTQLRVERSIYERIRLALVIEGYWPDKTLFPNTPQGIKDFDEAIKQCSTNRGFSIEPFGFGSQRKKYEKQTPRIVMITRRVIGGDWGNPINAMPQIDPLDPDNYQLIQRPLEASSLQIDIHLASANDNVADQDRIMNAIINKALGGQKFFVPAYDSDDERFFMHQYNYYDLPDSMEGITEKVYSYQVDDLFLMEDEVVQEVVSPIKQITIDIFMTEPNQQNEISDGSMVIDYSGIRY